jgi:general secretion pathway protein L
MALTLIAEAWRWWLREFLALLPELRRGRYRSQRRLVLLHAQASETELSVVKGRAAEWSGRIPHPASAGEAEALRAAFDAKFRGLAGSVAALLPRESVLRTELDLPQAAARHLEEAVSYKIERLSPFPPADTLYAIGPQRPEAASGEIALPILIAAKDRVEEIEARASALGFGLLGFAIEAAGPSGFERIAFAGRQGSPAGLPLPIRVLLVAGALLAATLALAPIAGKSRALAKIEAEIARLKPAAERAAKLKSARETQHGSLAKAAALRRAGASPLPILAKLSEALDDQSFLTELRLEGAALTLSGLSGDASGLAQKLGATLEFKSVKFVGPVTRDGQTPRDRFTLALELKGAP